MTKFDKKNELAKKNLKPEQIVIVWSAYSEDDDKAYMVKKKYTGQFVGKSKDDCFDMVTSWMSKKEEEMFDNQDEEIIYYDGKEFHCEDELIDYIKGY